VGFEAGGGAGQGKKAGRLTLPSPAWSAPPLIGNPRGVQRRLPPWCIPTLTLPLPVRGRRLPGITLGAKAHAANQLGVPMAGHRNAVVALCWLSMALFVVLLAVNGYLTAKLGRAYVSAARQQRLAAQQAAMAGGGAGIQMASPFPGAPYGAPPGAYPAAPGPYPTAYPHAWGAPQAVPAYGYPPNGWQAAAPPPGAPWGAAPPGPPLTHAVVGGVPVAAPGVPAPLAAGTASPAPAQPAAAGAGVAGYPVVGPRGAGAGEGPSSGVPPADAPGGKPAAL
jgi:hypothetical protein